MPRKVLALLVEHVGLIPEGAAYRVQKNEGTQAIVIDMALQAKDAVARLLSEEDAEAFAKKNSAPVQNAIKTSFILRTASMVVALVVAFLTKWFNPLATAIPMFAFRPLLTVVDAVMRKNDKTPDPSKFIRYEDNDLDDNKEEKEES